MLTSIIKTNRSYVMILEAVVTVVTDVLDTYTAVIPYTCLLSNANCYNEYVGAWKRFL